MTQALFLWVHMEWMNEWIWIRTQWNCYSIHSINSIWYIIRSCLSQCIHPNWAADGANEICKICITRYTNGWIPSKNLLSSMLPFIHSVWITCKLNFCEQIPSTESKTSKFESKSDDTEELHVQSAIVIQRNFRSFLWRRFFRNFSVELRYSFQLEIISF